MGNVVSSLLMYALQAAWFCQRLIDQDYRQNHGSRPKPIMNIDETDLDVFLSKCRSYYLSKTCDRGREQMERSLPPPAGDQQMRNYLRTEEDFRPEEDPAENCRSDEDEPDGELPLDRVCSPFDFDNEDFSSTMTSQTQMYRSATDGSGVEARDVLSKRKATSEISRSYRYRKNLERPVSLRSDSPKMERRNRKKFYYRNGRSTPRKRIDRSMDSPMTAFADDAALPVATLHLFGEGARSMSATDRPDLRGTVGDEPVRSSRPPFGSPEGATPDPQFGCPPSAGKNLAVANLKPEMLVDGDVR